jgi:hypothetical protein
VHKYRPAPPRPPGEPIRVAAKALGFSLVSGRALFVADSRVTSTASTPAPAWAPDRQSTGAFDPSHVTCLHRHQRRRRATGGRAERRRSRGRPVFPLAALWDVGTELSNHYLHPIRGRAARRGGREIYQTARTAHHDVALCSAPNGRFMCCSPAGARRNCTSSHFPRCPLRGPD